MSQNKLQGDSEIANRISILIAQESRPVLPLTLTALATLCIMTLYESLKQLIFPQITTWHSHLVTIIFSSAMTTIAAYFVLRSRQVVFRQAFNEITEHKQAEETLKKSEQQYRSVIEHIQDVFYRSDKNGRLTMASPSGARVFGYSSVDEMLGLPLDEFWLVPRERKAALAKIREMGMINDYEATFARKDGTAFPVSISAHFYFDESGAFQGTEGIIRDITERKQAQEALAQERNLLRTLIDSMPDHIYAKDTEGRFILKNKADILAMGASSTDEAIGKTDFDYYPREIAEHFHADDQRVILFGQPLVNHEERNVNTTGKEHWILTTKVPLRDSQGNVIGLVGIGRDITERKEAEETVKHYQEHLEELVERRTADLKAANERLIELTHAKDEFVSNVSHELRTPISSIKLREHLVRHHPDQLDEHLNVISRETNRLARTVEDLLQLSRLDQGRTELHPVSIDLNRLVKEYVTDRMPVALDKHLTIHFEGKSNLPQVVVDEGLMGQTLSILLTNAFNYTPSGGQVFVRIHTLQQEGRQWVGFGVSDTGPGISPEEQARLFTRFFRGEAGRKSGVPGTGLGLALAQEIVHRHKGRIEMESNTRPASGTTFKVWLPVRDETQKRED
jgi:two-component system sensor histidine kinase/response regulator